jgi:two-component system nitrogen regulation response regulator GlnG
LLAQAARHDDAPAAEGGIDAAVVRWLADTAPAPGTVYDAALAAFERPLFVEVLKATGGNQLRAAQVLGINRNTLRKRLSDLEIDPESYVRRA